MTAPALVVGGGIAGCAAALGLHTAGIAVEILEARDDADPADRRGWDARGGWLLTVAPNGVRAIRALGAGRTLETASWPMTEFVLRDADGVEHGTRRPLGGSDPVGFRLLTRAALVSALRSVVAARGIPLHRCARVRGVGSDDLAGPRPVPVRIGAQSRATPLLVGADGIGSAVRGHVDPAGPSPRPVGQRVFFGRTRARPFGGDGSFHVVASATQAFVAIPTAAGPTWWFARAGPPRPDGAPQTDPHGTLTAVLGRQGAAAAVLAATDPADLGAVDPHDLPGTGPWWRHRTVLAGDAAHAASPATGHGATLACEDAVVLAKSLRGADLGDHHAVTAALDRYHRLRRGRCRANIVVSAEQSGSPVPGGDPGAPLPDDVLHTHLDWDAVLPDP